MRDFHVLFKKFVKFSNFEFLKIVFIDKAGQVLV